jgi:6-phospho-beta-glucosidase
MGLKLAVVGGGSTYTPELVDGFARRADRVQVDEIALLDIDPERLASVGGRAERKIARQGWQGRVR